MATHDSALARPTAEWIFHYAASLLSTTPGLQPLDAVRQAMSACSGEWADCGQQPARPSASAREIAH